MNAKSPMSGTDCTSEAKVRTKLDTLRAFIISHSRPFTAREAFRATGLSLNVCRTSLRRLLAKGEVVRLGRQPNAYRQIKRGETKWQAA